MASAPAMIVTDSRPPAMSDAARLTNHWGELPPMLDTSQVASPAPIRRASSVAGAGPVRVMTSTTESRPTAPRSRGTWASAW